MRRRMLEICPDCSHISPYQSDMDDETSNYTNYIEADRVESILMSVMYKPLAVTASRVEARSKLFPCRSSL
jgi:hypothetical protein